jgi:hypothetical protein
MSSSGMPKHFSAAPDKQDEGYLSLAVILPISVVASTCLSNFSGTYSKFHTKKIKWLSLQNIIENMDGNVANFKKKSNYIAKSGIGITKVSSSII